MFLTIALAVTLTVLVFGYFHHCHQYWQSMGVFVPPTLPILGHLHTLFDRSENIFIKTQKLFRITRAPMVGGYLLLQRSLTIRDLSILKNIMVKDFGYFTDRRTFPMKHKKDAVMNEMLSLLVGEKWKSVRSIVSPTFTSGKLKGLFPLIEVKCKRLVDWCSENGREDVEMKEVFSRYTLDVIAATAFGMESSCIEHGNEKFTRAVKMLMNPTRSFKGLIKFILFMFFPWVNVLGMRVLDPSFDFLTETAKASLELRKKAETRRGDFIDLLMDAKAENEEIPDKSKYPVTDETIVSQIVLFILAGFETTSTALAFASYLLSRHPETQQRLRKELRELIETHGEINYQAIAEAKFLDAFFHETLRLYPPAPIVERLCTKDYIIPGTSVTIEKGQMITIPVWTLNRDPDTWEDPDTFRPERFLPENRTQEQSFAFNSFGQGPRNCIGMRFALLETKLVLAQLVLHFELQPAPGHEGPLELAYSMTTMVAEDGIHLRFKPLEKEA